jgi:hypothetical protein
MTSVLGAAIVMLDAVLAGMLGAYRHRGRAQAGVARLLPGRGHQVST